MIMNYWMAALAQINTTVGDLVGNKDKILRHSRMAMEAGASLVIFPEMTISGYPPEDLVLKEHFVRDCEKQLTCLAHELPQDILVIAGGPRKAAGGVANTAVIFYGGREAGYYNKLALPNYGVFDEKRLFVPGDKPLLLDTPFARIGIQICEDTWLPDAPWMSNLADARPDVVVNLSASPYHRAKMNERLRIIGRSAAKLGCPILYVNLVGGQDELVFDGASFVVGPDGTISAQARQFCEEVLCASFPSRAARHGVPASCQRLVVEGSFAAAQQALHMQRTPSLDDLAEVYEALKLGTRDYVEKNRFRRVVVALSGGIDSALVAAIAVDALGADRVVGITLPSQFNSSETQRDAEQLAKRLGIEFYRVPIQHLYEAYLKELTGLWRGAQPDITEENLQARIRGNIVMALSNKFGWLVLTTGNKSELATGYCTLYGDMAGGFAVIKDVPKTLVFELAKWRNRQGAEVIPETIIARPPSAELRPGQKDTDSLPPYEILDAILELYVEQDLGTEAIISRGFDTEIVRRVIRMVDLSEYKRRQGPPGIKITPRAFGRDRRMPITNHYRG
jgi:NAD+ synthase (glutamine-hydrolysing)